MTYLKTLIALTTLALLTACAGGVTINPVVNNNNGPTAATCTANPFATGCTTTPTQQATFCRDKSKTTDTKDSDCAPTVIRLCGENPFETGLCTEPTPTEAEAFCSDDTKSTATKANDCIPTISRVCGENPFEAGLCFDDNTYEPTRVQIRATCDNADGANTPRHALCPDIVVTECTADPFLAVCRLGTAGADDGTYGLERTKQIAATCPNNVHDIRCHGEEPYETTRQGILSNCETNVGTGNACPADVVMQVCIGNPYNTILCNDSAIDYTAQRLIRLNECKANNGLDGCAAAAATTCPANPFQAVLCFIDTTYEGDRTTQTQNCRDGVTDAPNCPDVLIAVCNADKFDTHCMGATDYIDAQRNECALATATTAQCNGVFAAALAGCLADPFSVACDTEATFTASRDSVRTSRFGFCETDQTNDARCAGYRTCSDADFAPITCGTDFNSARMMFCGTTANAFDPLCTANGLIDAAAQLAYCKLSTTNLFGTDCNTGTFTQARVEFCMATPNTDGCRADALGESLMSVTDPCAGGVCVVNTADWLDSFTGNDALTTTPNTTTRVNQFLQATATGFASGANAGIRQSFGSPTTDIAIQTLTFAEADTATGGLAFFGGELYSGQAGSETGTGTYFYYAGVLPNTNLGAPITKTITSARWMGQIRSDADVFNAKLTANPTAGFGLNITFDGAEGTIEEIFATGQFAYEIDGKFNDKGIISGTVIYSGSNEVGGKIVLNTDSISYSPGTLRGIIGSSGAVGVFHSDNANPEAGVNKATYSGGFVAAPPPPPDPCIAADNCVEFAAWEASLDTGGVNASQTLQESGYRNTGTNNSTYIKLDDGKIKFVSVATSPPHAATDRTFTPNILRLNETEGQDGYESGFAYVWNNLDFNGQIYAGILATTNLGAPLVDDSKDGTWTGRLGGTTSFAEPTLVADTFSLQVTFGGSSSEPGSVGTIESLDGDGVVGFAPVAGLRDGMRFRGDFNAAGVMWGKVNSNDAAGADNGTFSGLIGAKGAVGVFRNATSVSNYVGGFEVKPPAPSSP